MGVGLLGGGKGEAQTQDTLGRGTHDQVSWLASASEKRRKPVLYTKKKMKHPENRLNNHLYTWDQAVIDDLLVRSNVSIILFLVLIKSFHHSWTKEAATSTEIQCRKV